RSADARRIAREVLTERAAETVRRTDWLDEPARGNRVRERRARERQPVVERGQHRRADGEALLIDVVEEEIVREEPDAAAHDGLAVDEIREGAARQRLDQRVVGRAVGELQSAEHSEAADG